MDATAEGATRADAETPQKPILPEANAGSKRRKGGEPIEVDSQDKDAEKEKRKHVTKAVTAAVNLKKEAMLASQTRADILSQIGNNGDWAWANNEKTLGCLRECRQAIEDFKKSSDFWSQNFLQAQFAQYARRTWDDKYVLTEAARGGELDKLNRAMGRANDKTQRMHQQFMNDP